MTASRYMAVIMGMMLAVMLLTVVLSLTWVRQPQQGDLARIGGYVESAYGSRLPEARTGFAGPLYSRPANGEPAYEGYHDVVVFGDSFSYAGGKYNWVSQFVQLTGLKISVLNHQQRISTQKLSAWRESPPRLVIFQVVERDAVDYLAQDKRRLGGGESIDSSAPFTGLVVGPVSDYAQSVIPPKSFADFDERLSVTIDVFWKTLLRQFGSVQPEVVALPRKDSQQRIFSARNQDQLVVIPADLKPPPDERSLQIALSGFKALRDLTEANGETRFVLLVIPNRYSVYAQHTIRAYLPDKTIAHGVPLLTGMVNLLPALQSAVDDGVQDVYFPMDTHLSAVGSRIIARTLLDWLLQQGLVKPAR